ncbi:FK506-binding protein 2-like [Pomacea canaliculata]|uniref:FK506-binding protein 2-like n=1 Tax=Pomacea canaliculata TaxID=400727 RepID=UPI000D73029D|nr:FK506-binding protein 2-like [Pomacea canaliculata]
MDTSVKAFLFCLHFIFMLIAVSVGKKEADLKVTSTFKPDECSSLAEDGDEVAVHYTGYLDSGTVFDSSVKAQRDPLVFKLGEKRVIPGWEMGIKGMCVGEKRKLVIPPHLAYGKKGFPPAIPEQATLTFETELISLQKKAFNLPIMKTVQLMAIPLFIVYVAYYLYDRYKKETAETKETKKSKKRK